MNCDLGDIKKIFDNQDISEYKIVRNEIEVETYSDVYGEIAKKNEKQVNNLVRFKWGESVKEILLNVAELDGLSELISLAKVMPGTKYIQENFFCEKCQYDNQTLQELKVRDIILWILRITEKKSLELNYWIEKRKCNSTIFTKSGNFKQHMTKFKIRIFNKRNSEFTEYIFCDRFERDELNILEEKQNIKSKQIKLNGKVLIRALALKNIVNKIVEKFHYNFVKNGNSFFEEKDIDILFLRKDIELISLPYEECPYDSEGNFTQKKYLIMQGYIHDVLSNSTYANMGNGIISGDASIFDYLTIDNKRIIMKIPCKSLDSSDFEIIYFEPKLGNSKSDIEGTAYIKDGKTIVKSNLKINIIDFLNNLFYTNNKFEWHGNVLLTDVIYEYIGDKI